MRRPAALLGLVVALAACGPRADAPEGAPSGEPGESQNLVTPDGYAGIRVGMTLEEAAAVNGRPLVLHPPLDDPFACRTFAREEGDEGHEYYMAQQNRVSRISFDGPQPAARTPEGVGVGSTSAEVREAYPNAVQEGAPYDDPPAHDLIVWITPEARGYRFEVGQDGRVRAMHAGDASIRYIEGCA